MPCSSLKYLLTLFIVLGVVGGILVLSATSMCWLHGHLCLLCN